MDKKTKQHWFDLLEQNVKHHPKYQTIQPYLEDLPLGTSGMAGITKNMARTYLQSLLRQLEKGRITAYHGTTLQNALKILNEGFKVGKPNEIVKEAYEEFGIPWAARKKIIPKEVRRYIEHDVRRRMTEGDFGTVSFAPTRSVSEVFAGVGGEVKSIIWKGLSEWFEAKRKGITPTEFVRGKVPTTPQPYLGPPAVLKVELTPPPLDKKRLSQIFNDYLDALKYEREYSDFINYLRNSYYDIALKEPDLENVVIKKLLPKRPRRP